MSLLSISIDLGDMLPTGGALTAETFPNLAAAVQAIAQRAHGVWADYAAGQTLPSGKVIQDRTGTYLRSIMVRQTGEFAAEVYSELPYARAIEEGSPARDLKTILNSSTKVRLTKDGRRYLIIPFRWNSPGSVLGRNMPVEVHNWWGSSDRASSAITGTYRRPSGTGAHDIRTRERITVPGWRYKWGSRLGKGALGDLGFGPKDTVAKRLEGMVRFRKPGGTGRGSHTQFLTFRVMMEGSSGWIAPAQEGKFPARSTAELVGPQAEELFREAMALDVKALLGGA